MTDLQESPAEVSAPADPELLERGRYAITQMPDGAWVIARAAPICETCQACGCGEQADPIGVPAMVVGLITMDPEKRAKMNPVRMMKGLMGNAG